MTTVRSNLSLRRSACLGLATIALLCWGCGQGPTSQGSKPGVDPSTSAAPAQRPGGNADEPAGSFDPAIGNAAGPRVGHTKPTASPADMQSRFSHLVASIDPRTARAARLRRFIDQIPFLPTPPMTPLPGLPSPDARIGHGLRPTRAPWQPPPAPPLQPTPPSSTGSSPDGTGTTSPGNSPDGTGTTPTSPGNSPDGTGTTSPTAPGNSPDGTGTQSPVAPTAPTAVITQNLHNERYRLPLVSDTTAPVIAHEMNDSGGIVVVSDPSSPLAGAQVEVPGQALSATAYVGIAPSLVTPPPGAFGFAVEFTPDGQQFAAPVRIALPYDAAALAAAGFSPSQLSVLYYNPATARWQTMPGSTVDAAKGLVFAPTTHFSDYVAGVAPPSVTDVSPSAALVGQIVQVNGSNFEPIAENNTVLIGGQPATVVGVDADAGTFLQVQVPGFIPTGLNDISVTAASFADQPAALAGGLNNLSSRAYILNGSNDISLVDPVAQTVVRTLPVGADPVNGFPFAIAIRGDGTFAYVSNMGEQSLAIIDGVNQAVLLSLDLSATGEYPAYVKLSPDQSLLVVGFQSMVALIDVDPANAGGTRYTVLNVVPLIDQIVHFTFSLDGSRLYVPTSGSQRLYEIDANRASPTFGTATDLGITGFGFTFDVVANGKELYLANQDTTISRVGIDPSDSGSYRQVLTPIGAPSVPWLTGDISLGTLFTLWNDPDTGLGQVESIDTASDTFSSGVVGFSAPIMLYQYDPSSQLLLVVHNDGDDSTPDAVSVLDGLPSSPTYMQILAAFPSGNVADDAGISFYESIVVVANGQSDTVTLVDLFGTNANVTLSAPTAPSNVAMAPVLF